MNYKILVVDDDKKTVELIRLSLKNEHFETLEAYDGIEALALTRSEAPDLIILDWLLPHIGGLDLCRIIRAESTIPVILLTARATEEDRLLGLNLGADDYLTKPFSLRELVARVRIAPPNVPVSRTSSNAACWQPGHRLAGARGLALWETIPFKLLETFTSSPCRHPPGTGGARYGLDYDGFDRTIDFHLGNLRKKIDADPEYHSLIQTVHGVGYKFRRADDVE